MTDRKNLKIDPDTYDLLKEQKGQFQTWDQFFWDAFSDQDTEHVPEAAEGGPPHPHDQSDAAYNKDG